MVGIWKGPLVTEHVTTQIGIERSYILPLCITRSDSVADLNPAPFAHARGEPPKSFDKTEVRLWLLRALVVLAAYHSRQRDIKRVLKRSEAGRHVSSLTHSIIHAAITADPILIPGGTTENTI